MEPRTKTKDVLKTLEQYAEELGCSVDDLDFKILSFELVGPENNRYVAELEIEITFKVPGIIEIFDAVVEIEEKGVMSYAYIKVFPTFKMQVDVDLLEKKGKLILTDVQKDALVEETFKLLIKNGVIYGIYPEEKIIESWEEAIKTVYLKKSLYSFKVAEGKPPKDPYRREIYVCPLVTVAGKVINERSGRIDFKDRGYSDKKVSAGDLLAKVEYIPGEYGVKVTGELIPYKELDPFPYSVDEDSIEIKEKKVGKKMIYELYAKKDGYLQVDHGMFYVSEYVKERAVDYSTGSIKFDEEGIDIEVGATGDKALVDAVKDEFELISPGKNVIIRGNVGRKAKVEGKNVVVDGTLAKDALVKAEVCSINNAIDAKIEAQRAIIDKCINSEVEANEVFVNNLVGGVVYGEDIVALKVVRHCKLKAYRLILVEKADDFNNFVLDPKEVPFMKKKIEFLETQIKKIERELELEDIDRKKALEKMEAQIKLFINYLTPSLKENAVKLGAAVRKFISDKDKLEKLLEKFPKFAKRTVDQAREFFEDSLEHEKNMRNMRKELAKLQVQLREILGKSGCVIVLDSFMNDNQVTIGGVSHYFSGFIKGPLVIYKKADKIVYSTDIQTIRSKMLEALDGNREKISHIVDFLLDKGLRTYVVSLRLGELGA